MWHLKKGVKMAKKSSRGINTVTRPRADGSSQELFEVRVYWDDRRHLLGRFKTLGEAETVLAIARGQIASGVFVPPADAKRARRAAIQRESAARYTYRQWTEEWLHRLAAAGRTQSTIISYRSVLKVRILPALGDVPLQAITPRMIEALMDDVRAQPSARYPGAHNNGITTSTATVLRASLNAAVKAERLEISPFRRPTAAPARVRPGSPRDDVATPAQVLDLTAAMPEHLALAVPLAAWCQLRLGEVLGLQRRDFTGLDDPSNAFVHVSRQLNSKTSELTAPKSRAGYRSLSVPPDVVPLITDHLERYAAPGPEGFVFTRPNAPGRYVADTTFGRAWLVARKKVGMPGFRFHDLRHTGLTMYAQLGATQAELMHRGGHSDVQTVARYQHATLERDRLLADALSRALKVPSIKDAKKKRRKPAAG